MTAYNRKKGDSGLCAVRSKSLYKPLPLLEFVEKLCNVHAVATEYISPAMWTLKYAKCADRCYLVYHVCSVVTSEKSIVIVSVVVKIYVLLPSLCCYKPTKFSCSSL